MTEQNNTEQEDMIEVLPGHPLVSLNAILGDSAATASAAERQELREAWRQVQLARRRDEEMIEKGKQLVARLEAEGLIPPHDPNAPAPEYVTREEIDAIRNATTMEELRKAIAAL